MRVLVNIDVDDIDLAIAFYQSALPLQLSRRLFGGEIAELSGASSTLYLLQKSAGSSATDGVGSTRDYRRHWTPVHLDFVVDDIDAAAARAIAAGARQEAPIESHAWGKLVTLSDPFGNGFCLVQFPGTVPYSSG